MPLKLVVDAKLKGETVGGLKEGNDIVQMMSLEDDFSSSTLNRLEGRKTAVV